MAKKQETKSRRQAVREQRLKRQRQQRLITILVVAGVAIIIAGFLIYPSLQRSMAPVGEVVQITPVVRPEGEGVALGDPAAPVLVEVWSDFQCPACRNYAEGVEPLVLANYVANGKARYVYRHYPFLDDGSLSKESDQAAHASMCAADQGRFWDYHDILFANWNGENIGSFRDKRLIAFAEALNLDMDQFSACFNEGNHDEEINKDLADGNRAGVSGTPSVFVNGKILTPGRVPSFEDIAAAIDAASTSGN